jgi:biopolymer transport protein ExbB/TolQ
MDYYTTIVRFFQEGGVFMYPILIVLALGVAIALERWLYLLMVTGRNRRSWNQLQPLLHAGRFREALAQVEESNTAVSRIVRHGLARLASARTRDDVEMAMEEGMMEVMPRLEKRTHYLATLANIATLLGLLGTIIGLIQAFTAVANANPADKADMLSASISVAMNTTAFGLIVGIPLLLTHALLQSKTSQLVDSLEMAVIKVLNSIGQRPAKEAATV